MSLPRAHDVSHSHSPDATVTLNYEDRFLRRKTLVTEAGERFLVDLPRATSLAAGDAFVLDDGRIVGVVAAPEALLEITGDLPRLAWHIGNRHAPAQIEPARILVRFDRVMADMLARLGATLREVDAPFTPEGGAYGPGRTHGHDPSAVHGPVGHDHGDTSETGPDHHSHDHHAHDHHAHDH